MGFNSTLVILNDRLHEISKTPDFGEQVYNAIAEHGYNRPRYNHPVGTEVVSVDHADVTNVIAVGGNCATVLNKNYNGGRHHSEESQLALLKYWADEMGYTLHKKRKK